MALKESTVQKMNSSTQKIQHDEYRKLSLSERIGYGLGDFAQNLVFGTVGGFLALYLTTVNAIGTAAAGFIFLFVRIINVFWDPMVGTFVDKHTFKNGKYRPWLPIAGIPLVILAAMLFVPIPAIRSHAWFGVYMVYMVLGAVALFLCYRLTKEHVVATAEQSAQVKAYDLFVELKNNKLLVILGFFFMLAFTFMFFMNTVNGFFNQYQSTTRTGWVP